MRGPEPLPLADVQLPFFDVRTGIASPGDGGFVPSLWPRPGRLLPSLGDGMQPESQDQVHASLRVWQYLLTPLGSPPALGRSCLESHAPFYIEFCSYI